MTPTTLHYLYDPLCGWCYAAAPLIAAARTLPGLAIEMHAGGMMAGAARQRVSEQLRRYVMEHDRRIATMTGQAFGDAYFNGLLTDHTVMLDSEPPIAAILAAQALAVRGLDMLSQLQRAHYVEGLRIAERATLVALAVRLGLAEDAYAVAFDQQREHEVHAHIAASRRLLAEVGGQGFPTVFIESNGRRTRLEIGRYLGKPGPWVEALARSIAPQAGPA